MSNIVMRYLGGAWIHGVPARDLTADEAAQHGALIAKQEAATGMKMYEPIVPQAQPAKATKQAAQPAQEE